MRQRKGCLWLALGLILALVAGAMVFVTLQRATAGEPVVQEIPRTEVVVAARDIPMGAVIQEEDVVLKEVPPEVVPKDAVLSLDEAVGKMTTVELVSEEMLLASKLIAPTKELAEAAKEGGKIAFTIEEGKVVMAFPTQDLMSSLGLLEPGDRIDILCSLDIQEETAAEEGALTGLVTFNSLQNLEIAALVMPPDMEIGERTRPDAILLALDPQDALVLKHLIDAGGIIDIVLRAPTDEQLFETLPVNMDYLIDRYRIRIPISP
ncbi:MAG TPA: Flp pilus assembly protein CpaB [Anaerolineae bacterium]|nr:Flp pilus assembly protein CpaB [Anaerolineae bacterium]